MPLICAEDSEREPHPRSHPARSECCTCGDNTDLSPASSFLEPNHSTLNWATMPLATNPCCSQYTSSFWSNKRRNAEKEPLKKMAARLFRTLAADEVVSDGGVKLGMLGTGGRTYRNYSRGREPVCCRCYFLTRVIALLLLVWAVVMAIVSESSLSAVTHCADRASREATSLSTSSIGGPVQQANDWRAASKVGLFICNLRILLF